MIFLCIPLLIGILFGLFWPFQTELPLMRVGIAIALISSILGVIITMKNLSWEGALLINCGFIAFLVQYFISLSKVVGAPIFLWLFAFSTIFFSSLIYLINMSWLMSRYKIAHDLFLKLSKGGSIVFFIDSLILIVYICYVLYFGNIYLSLGGGLIVIGLILIECRHLFSSKKLAYWLILILINLGLSILIYWGFYVLTLNLYIALFSSGMIGIFMTLISNIIAYGATHLIRNIVWYRIFCSEFLCISVLGACLFGSLSLDPLLKIALIILWINIISFGTLYFGEDGELFSLERYRKLKLIAKWGIRLELPFLLAVILYNLVGPLVALFVFGIIMNLFNFRSRIPSAIYLALSIGLATGLSVAILLLSEEAELWQGIIFIIILLASAICLGAYRIIKRKAEEKP